MNNKQELFKDMVLGVLVYSVVLGFFNDYTEILQTTSYSTTFAVAVVMQILTYFTFELKKLVAKYFKGKSGPWNKTGLVFFVWLIMFVSKFIFLAVIGILFNDSVYISGFVGLLAIIIVMTGATYLIERIHGKLGDN